ncbi:aminodeoxychorismate lyase [Vibrio sp. 10N.286.49.B3]|uniref:aminodeoxychorismate lyase n=1 Tax=Vibrio sp. 10N.286.49.B3 TaxID=1880855 RepID=UPI000C82CDEC|nr:aminodeoxychorismate lyase [Vibrio sp. 10N.286.49.B3]PMH46800.1 aminodeoxychorismate lyase [Vibrio sp. 10N.286.49.B3]
MYWVNGERTKQLELSDRSFQYGDGCFTTMQTRDGQIDLFEQHQQRVDACLAVLAMPALDWTKVKIWLDKAVSSSSLAGIKLHISRGQGGRGYSFKGVGSPVVTISAFEYPQHYLSWQHSGVKLGVCQQRLGLVPMLAGHKHNNRLEQVLLKAEMDQQGEVDGIVLDINHHVIETTMANIFWTCGNILYTPALDQSGVAGVMRKQVLKKADLLGLIVKEGQYTFEHLLDSEEVFMTNSILGVAPITAIQTSYYSIGPHTKALQGILNS